MTPTGDTIPTAWVAHGYAPRDMLPIIRLIRADGTFVLKLTALPRYMIAICIALSIGLLAWWYVGAWGKNAHDSQMKWIAFGGGLAFSWLAGSYALTARRHANSGQRFLADMARGRIQIESPSLQTVIPLGDVIGLQVLHSVRGAQLNLVYNGDSGVERAWIHTDAPANIVSLALSFTEALDFNVVSEFTIRVNLR